MTLEGLRILRDSAGGGVLAVAPLGDVDDEGRAACVACTAIVELDDPEGVYNPREYRRAGDHRGGCGLSCDTCGDIIVAACDPCRASIEGVS